MSAKPPAAARTWSLREFARHVDLPSAKSPLFRKWNDARKILSDLAWDQYSANAYEHYRVTRSAVGSPPIERTGLYDRGRLSPGDAATLLRLFNDCPAIALSADDFHPGYNFDPSGSLAKINSYRRMTPAFEAKLSEVLASIAPAVEQICGHFVRIVSSHIWSLNPGPRNYQWHLDWWPLALKKLFIFPSGADESLGSTAFRLKTGEEVIVRGPPGTWMIFENSALEHKGIESQVTPRPTIAINLAPAFRTDLSLFDAGTNSGFPWFPIESVTGTAAQGIPDYYGPGTVNDRILKSILQLAGLGHLLTPGGVIPDPLSVNEAMQPPAAPAANDNPPRPTLRQRLRPRQRLKALFRRLRSQ